MTISLLGPLVVDGDGSLSPRDRVVLAVLAMHAGESVSTERLADALWARDPPKSWSKVVQGSVLRLRRTLGRDAVQTTAGGYRLAVSHQEIDVRRFEDLVTRGRSLVAAEPDRAAVVLAQALQLWRGPPLADLEGWAPGRGESLRLEELRHSAQELRLEADLACGRDTVAAATALAAEQPLRESRWALLAQSLYRSGRQAEALAALRRARRLLLDELGLDPGPALVELERAILHHDPELDSAAQPWEDRGRCPYKGLLAYDRDDAESFFGREAEVKACVRLVTTRSLVLVVGPSGCGKSSLVRAGVVPVLEQSGPRVLVTTPGTDPLGAIAGATSSAARPTVIVVDQLEEAFTGGHGSGVAERFLDELADLAGSGTRVVAVLRADHVGGLAASSVFSRRAEGGVHLVTPMTGPELTAAMEGPAAQAGLRLEPGLAELLAKDVTAEPGALPLLSHALAETWTRREAAVLTVEGYRDTGGIRGAVAQTAEALYESLPPRRRTVARSLFLRLVNPSEDGEPNAARVASEVLRDDPERRAVIDLLIRARLVTADEHTIVVAHEAVLRAWPRLRSWLDDDVSGQRMLRHLTLAAEDWQGRGRPDSELYRGARLEAALAWRRQDRPGLTPVESSFLDASAARVEAESAKDARRAREQAQQNRRLRSALVGAGIALLLVLLAGTAAVQQRRDADVTAVQAQIDRLVAQSVALRATSRDLATLLAIEAYRRQPDAETRGALFGVFTAAPGFLGYLPADPDRPGIPLTSGHVMSDGRTLLATGNDGVVRAFDLEQGDTGTTFPPPGIAPSAARLAVSEDSRTVAVVAWQGSPRLGGLTRLNVYDAVTRQRHFGEIRLRIDAGAVAVSGDGRYIAVSGNRDGDVVIVDATLAGALPTTSEIGSDTPVAAVRWLPPPPAAADLGGVRHTAALTFRKDGLLLVGSTVGEVRVVDPVDGTVVSVLSGGPQGSTNNHFAQSPDGSVLVSTGSSAVARWDLHAGRPLWVAPITEERCRSAAVVVVRGAVLCGSEFGHVTAIDVGTGQLTSVRYDMQHGEISSLLVTPDGRELLELSGSDGTIARWRLDGTGPVTRSLVAPGVPQSYSADGRLLIVTRPRVSGTEWPDVDVVDAQSGAVVDRLDGYATPVWTNHAGRLAAWDLSGVGWVLEVGTHRKLTRLNGGFGEPPVGAATAAREDRLVAWGKGKAESIVIWDLLTGERPGRSLIRVGDTASPDADAKLMVVFRAGEPGIITREIRTGERLAQRDDLMSAAVSPSGLVAASTLTGQLGFYDLQTLRASGRPLAGAPGVVRTFSFSRDGRLLAVVSADGAARLVDTESRTQLGEAIPLGAGVDGAALRPDGLELAVPSDDSILLWQLDPRTWQDAACRTVGRDLTREEWEGFLAEFGDYRSTCLASHPDG